MNSVNLQRERLKQKLTLAFIVITYIPFFIFAQTPSSEVNSIVSYLASQTGYLAATLLLWQFILGSRSVSALIHKDLVWVTTIHKNLGKYGIALVLLHPLLIAYSYSEQLLYLFWDSFETEFQIHVWFGRVALLLFLLIWLTSVVARARLGYRPWKYIHYLSYVIFPFVLLHTPEIGSFYAAYSFFRIVWQLFIAIYFLMLALRLRHFFTYGQYPHRLVKKKEAAPGVLMYQLEPLKKRLEPSPGQFVYLRRGFWSEEHPFSVAAYSGKNGQISIAAKVFGKFTRKLSRLEIGSIVYLDGPYGVFTQEIVVDPNRPSTLIAGGIGITPFIRHVLSSKNEHLTLFNANRGKENVVIHGLLKKALGDRYIDVYSDQAVEGAESGRVDAELLKKHLGEDFDRQHFYICGPPAMMKGVKKSLVQAGISSKQISSEEFNF